MFPIGEDTSTSKSRLNLLCVSKYLRWLERYSEYERKRFQCNICSFIDISRLFDLQAELEAHIRAMYVNQISYRSAGANPSSNSSHAKEPDHRDMKTIS